MPSVRSRSGRIGMHRLRAQTADVACGVVAGKRREIDQRDRAQQPPRLPLLLYGAAPRQRRGATLDRAAVDPLREYEVEIERHARVAGDVVARKLRAGHSPEPVRLRQASDAPWRKLVNSSGHLGSWYGAKDSAFRPPATMFSWNSFQGCFAVSYSRALLVLALVAGANVSGAQPADSSTSESVAPGVIHARLVRLSGPFVINIIGFDLRNGRYELRHVRAFDRLRGREKTTAMVARLTALGETVVGAINARFLRSQDRRERK